MHMLNVSYGMYEDKSGTVRISDRIKVSVSSINIKKTYMIYPVKCTIVLYIISTQHSDKFDITGS